MDWKDIAKDVAKLGLPALGTAIGGPAGASVGNMLASALGCGASPSEVQQALVTNPDAAVKLKELETQVTLATISAATSQVEAVNKTLQTEAMGGSYWQRNHHAFESSFVCLLVAGIYIGLPMANIPVPPVPESVWLMLGGILGVTAWMRGTANTAIAQNQTSGG